jgi:polyhydroxyalkanoate synthesis repressor PhaR
MPPKSILIKKYENRRLYDVTNSGYVNLDGVSRLLKDGYDVRVVDASSGKDITRSILTQIIVENARDPDSTFPLDLLREMIISSGRASQENALRYMKSMLNLYQDTYRAMSPAVNPFEIVREGGGAEAPGQSAVPPANPPRDRRTSQEEGVDELKRRVAGLEKLVSSLSPKTAVSRKSGRRSKTRERKRPPGN